MLAIRMPGRQLITYILACGLSVNGFGQSAAVKGIDSAYLYLKADPCADFYEFANGTWRAQHPIPKSMDRWSRRWEAGEVNKDQLRVILDRLQSEGGQPKGTPSQLTRDFYHACIDQTAVDRAGLAPLEPLLARVAAIRDLAGLQAALVNLHGLGVQVPFYLYGNSDLHDPQNVIADVGAGGLGLPDRDYYLKPEKRFADARAGYVKHVAKMFRLAGSSDSDAAAPASVVMTFETALAKASFDTR